LSEQQRKPKGSDRASATSGSASVPGKTEKSKKGAEVGRALRTVYDSTLNEEIPDDFLDLLGKLS
jgi:hypothetical protein